MIHCKFNKQFFFIKIEKISIKICLDVIIETKIENLLKNFNKKMNLFEKLFSSLFKLPPEQICLLNLQLGQELPLVFVAFFELSLSPFPSFVCCCFFVVGVFLVCELIGAMKRGVFIMYKWMNYFLQLYGFWFYKTLKKKIWKFNYP